ncbi:MAG TPA: MFS transporter, partial [Eggerthellaceae bacterium]|nr:MFS transporter [Eggerthellaceae bacterium]
MIEAIKRHYEKIICACCFLLLFTNVGLASTSFSVYQPYLVELPGVGHSGGSVIISIRTFISLIAMFFVARYYDKLDCRKGVAFASFCIGVGFVLYALNTSNYVGLCIGSVFTGLGYGLGGMVASTMLIGRWFKDHVATAAGIAAVGSGVAAVVVPPVVVALESALSLSSAFAAEGVLAIVDALLLYALLRNKPEDIGLTPYVDPKLSRTLEEGSESLQSGLGKNGQDATKRSVKREKPKKRSQARISRNLPPKMVPVVFVAMVFVGSVSVGGSNYLAVLFTSEGFTTEYAAMLVSISGACLMVSKLFTGVIFDKIGTAKGSLLFFAIFIAGIVMLCLSDMGNHNLALFAVLLYGTGLALGTVGISI